MQTLASLWFDLLIARESLRESLERCLACEADSGRHRQGDPLLIQGVQHETESVWLRPNRPRKRGSAPVFVAAGPIADDAAKFNSQKCYQMGK
jgi:hypothetical protein